MSAAERTPVNRADCEEGDRVCISYTASTHEYQKAAIEGVVTDVKRGEFGKTVRFVYIESEHDRYRVAYGGSLQREDNRVGWVSEGYLAKIERAPDQEVEP